MKRSLVLCLIAVVCVSCAVRPVTRDFNVQQEPGQSGRYLFAAENDWSGAYPDAVIDNIIGVMNRAVNEDFDTVILHLGDSGMLPGTKAPGSGSEGFDPLALAIEEARQRNLRLFVSFDLLRLDHNGTVSVSKKALIDSGLLCAGSNGELLVLDGSVYLNPVRPVVRSRLKKAVRNLAALYDIDGLYIQNRACPDEILCQDSFCGSQFEVDSKALGLNRDEWSRLRNEGVLEDVIAEALLVKSWLHIALPSPPVSSADTDRTPDNLHSGNDIPISYMSGSAQITAKILSYSAERIVSLDMGTVTSAENLLTFRAGPGGTLKAADSNDYVSFILPELPDTLLIEADSIAMPLSTRRWNLPFKYTVLPDSTVTRDGAWVEFRRAPKGTTASPEFHMLAKASYPARTLINGNEVKQYNTGIFFDKIELAEGSNRIRAEAVTDDGPVEIYERKIVYQPVDRTRDSFPLWINERSVEPAVDHRFLPGDSVRLSFTGSKGQKAYARLKPGGMKIQLLRQDYSDYSRYSVELPLDKLKTNRDYRITYHLESDDSQHGRKKISLQAAGVVEVRRLSDFPLVRTVKRGSVLTYNTGPIRLGGPVIAEYDSGVVMKVSGMIGDSYRIRLDKIENGSIDSGSVETLPAGTVKPSYFIRSMSTAPSDSADIVRIPYSQSVPYAVHPEPDRNRIIINLYGVMTSSTWVTHRTNLKLIERLSWRQTTPETYQVIIHLKSSKIWGYDLKQEGSLLVFRLKYPPLLSSDEKLPLKGLKVAIEAGHGGSSIGAVGLSGLFEKDVNLDVAHKLAALCREKGAGILQVRDTDKSMWISTKRDTVRNSDADLFVSIHANAGGLSGGYLRVGGTSTYYHNPFWAEFAEIMYDRLLELDLDEFGVVGSFNYRVTRQTVMPSILVEQAFMSHAGDEEKLASEEFRQQMAQKICDGIIDYISYMME